jgi:Uma2 family endonuclease
MAETARRLATWDDLARTPEDGRTYEVLNGELEASPRPTPAHNWAQSALSGEVHPPFGRGRGGPGGWWILVEPDVMLERHQIVVPDFAARRRDRLPDLAAQRPLAVVPDWMCEVVSPADPGRDRVRKSDLYLRTGVPHYWIVDPADRTLEAFESSEGRWVRLGAWTDGDTPRVPPFEAIELDVAGLFLPRQAPRD